MKPVALAGGRSDRKAFSLIENLVVLVVVVGLAATVILPLLARRRVIQCRINCVNNLKQTGLAFRTWALDNGDHYPMQVSITLGGTMELVTNGNAFAHFRVMSNELSTPKILFCPQETDPMRQPAWTFASAVPPSTGMIPYTGDTNISYFVGVDATDVSPQMILSGDRNLCVDGVLVRRRLLNLWTNSVVTWNVPRHEKGGNIAFADGSVGTFRDKALARAFSQTGSATNRLHLP